MEAIVIATDFIPAAELIGDDIMPKFSVNFTVKRGRVPSGKIANYAKMQIAMGTTLFIDACRGESVITGALT